MAIARGAGPVKKLRPDTVKRIVGSFSPYKGEVVWTVILVVASVVLGLLSPLYLKHIVDFGLAKNDIGVTATYSIYTIVVTILGSAATYGYGYLSVDVGQRILRDIRNQLFGHLQGMSLRFFTNTRTGEIQSRLLSDVGGVQSVVSDVITNALSNIGIVVASIAMMVYFDWRLTLLSVGVIPIFAYLSSRAGTYAQKVRKGLQEQTAELNALMQETLSVSGVLLTKTSGRRSLVEAKFGRENQKLANWQVKIQMIQYFFFGLIRMIFSITPALVYWLAAYLMRADSHAITLGTLVAFTALQSRMFFPLSSILSVQVEMKSSLALFDRIFEYLDMEQDIKDRPGAITLLPNQVVGDVEFKDVGFKFEEGQEKPTLSNISFQVNPGRLVALVGPSGAGKTTLTYLLARLYDVTSGAVMIDGHDVRDIKVSSMEAFVGSVTQETYLIHDTVRENLRYARPDATDEQIEAAAKAAKIHDHVAALPEGYDTIVGERGYKLSGGEKQRLAIARAILKDPRILILDEATSALDTHSERYIQGSLNALMEGRTTFAIAHRLSTILAADLILVMRDGMIVERGRHEELLAKRGLYFRLYTDQFEHEAPNSLP
ncbi:MAG TPA: ABC transporter ATP-binding protein [Fimbriimonadaceae bacterium]|nr:ABC transporter ATP-binding protein [Fimbriimonadaceae bacterium]